jgi:photosystem II stability/assembly factor-like uncharacterized protein
MLVSLRRVLAVTVVAGALVTGTGSVSVAGRAPEAGVGGRGSLSLSWELTPTGTSERFRGLSAVSDSVAWVGSNSGTVLRTIDGGATWVAVGPSGIGALQFRDVEATSERHAVILASGSGQESRIYVTDDGGASWTRAFQNDDDLAFYDCMAFSTPQRGLAVSDPVGGVFRLQETTDGGHTWSLVDPEGMPPAQATEFAFAASGTCLTAGQGQTTYLATGGIDPPRLFVSKDRGHTWRVTTVPIVGSPSAGAFSVRFRDRHNGIVVGGNLADVTASIGTGAWSDDGGWSWHPASVTPRGYRSGSSWLPHERDVAVAVGPTGSDVTTDAGRTWSTFDSGSFDSVECSSDGACWASGEQGRVAKLVVSR